MCEYSKKSKIRKEKIVERDIGRERESGRGRVMKGVR